MKANYLRYKIRALQQLSSNSLFWFILLLIMLTLIQAMPAMAFCEKPNIDPEQIIATMQERLNLTDERLEKIRPIVYEQSENRRDLIEKYQYQGRSAMREEMQEMRSETDARLAEILSVQQWQEYQKIKNQRRERMDHKFRSRRSRMF